MNDIIAEKLKLLPDEPGVYKMYDGSGEIIYVGKAVNLKNRVRQYFQHTPKPPKVEAMVSHIEDFQYIITSNETEALTLESNLIKALMPRYNILLKDDKHFPYVRLDTKQDFPRFEVVRKVKKDGAKYFALIFRSLSLKDALTAIRDIFPGQALQKRISIRPSPAMSAPASCTTWASAAPVQRQGQPGGIPQAAGKRKQVPLRGTGPIIELFTEQMQSASENMEYEKAAQLRDRIKAIKSLAEKQQAISVTGSERDIFAFVKDQDSVVFALFERGGKIIWAESMSIACGGETTGEIMASFLKQHYADGAPVPKEIVVRDMPEEKEALSEWLSENRGCKVEITCPQRGEKKKLAEMAYRNGVEAIQKARELEHRSWERGEGAMLRLCEIIGLDEMPERMECYDNSHIRGRDTVSGMVVFINGKSAPKEYRRFRIKEEVNGDDYMAMREVLTRRFQRAKDGDEKFTRLPDLLVVDGGRGQLNVALEVLEEFGLSHIPAIGLAEQNEDIILPDKEEPIRLSRRDPALHILERIRDEAHRFAITYHRSLRAKNALMSELDGIDGIGPKRKRALFDAFITSENIRNASIEELCGAKGMSKPAAEKVFAHFHPEERQEEGKDDQKTCTGL